MRMMIAIALKYFLLGATVLVIAVLLAVGACAILVAIFGRSLPPVFVVSLLATVAAIFILGYLLPRAWRLYSKLKSNSVVIISPISLVRFAKAARFGDVSLEWFKSDQLLEMEYADFDIPHFQPSKVSSKAAPSR